MHSESAQFCALQESESGQIASSIFLHIIICFQHLKCFPESTFFLHYKYVIANSKWGWGKEEKGSHLLNISTWQVGDSRYVLKVNSILYITLILQLLIHFLGHLFLCLFTISGNFGREPIYP